MTLYERLYEAYGPRHWWPADGPFEVIVGAILTQNTAWRNVLLALENLRAAGMWSFEALHEADRGHLAQTIRPSGYYNVKARKLQEFAAVVIVRFGGSLDDMLARDASALREMLLGIWGIGEETADDIVLYAANKPSFVIDAYTRRIVDRLGWNAGGSKYGDYQAMFASHLPQDAQLFNEYHALLDFHASRTCRKTPLCSQCALRDVCNTGRQELA